MKNASYEAIFRYSVEKSCSAQWNSEIILENVDCNTSFQFSMSASLFPHGVRQIWHFLNSPQKIASYEAVRTNNWLLFDKSAKTKLIDLFYCEQLSVPLQFTLVIHFLPAECCFSVNIYAYFRFHEY